MATSWEFLGGALCLDFLNTVHCYGAEDPRDDLRSPEDLLSWAVAAGVVSRQESTEVQRDFQEHPTAGERLLRDAKHIRDQLREIFKSRRVKPKPTDVELLNSLLGEHSAVPAIANKAGDLAVHWCPTASPGIVLPILLSAAELVTGGQWARVRECGSATCTFLFLDTSKNHSRRWCDMRVCGNRAKVAGFRLRHGR